MTTPLSTSQAMATFNMTLIFFLLLVCLTSANVCDWKDAFPVLYHEYRSEQCPPNFNLRPDGKCDYYWESHQGQCGSFCQMRTVFFYGPEQPYVRVPFCRGGLTCKLSESAHQGYNYKVKANVNLKLGPLTLGITGGIYNHKWSTSQSYSIKKRLKKGQCGYFTFIPIFKEACGTYTAVEDDPRQRCDDTPYTTPNSCATFVQNFQDNTYDDDRTIRGLAIFVWTDCETLEPLPDDQQDVAFTKAGVKLPRDTRVAYNSFWQRANGEADKDGAASVWADNISHCSSQNLANALDCQAAVNRLLESPDAKIVTRADGSGNFNQVSTEGECAVRVYYDEPWNDNCRPSWLEVNSAAQIIMDNCQADGRKSVGGDQRLRPNGQGQCGSHVVLTRN